MNLDELLKAVDADVAAPRRDEGLGARVRERARRRGRLRMAGGALSLVLCAIAAWWALRMRADSVENVAARRAEQMKEMLSLRMEVEMHARMAERLCAAQDAAEREARLKRALALPAALEELATERDVVAAALVRCGDRAGNAAEAARSYRCVIANFAESSFAVAAQERLKEMK